MQRHVRPRKQAVLIVDDEAIIRTLLQEVIEHRGYESVAVSTGEEAFALLTEDSGRFAAVVSDQTMPDLLGTDLLGRLRQLGNQIPFVLCSGYSQGLDESRAATLGADAFLRKPLDINVLGDTVVALIRGE